MAGIGIVSIGSYAPEKKLTNADLEKMVDTTDEWIMQRTGIRERHLVAPGQHASDLATEAARNCLQGVSVKPDLVISSSSTGEASCPYQASLVANKLSLGELAAFDICAACSGLVYGIAVADGMMKTGAFRNVLLTAGEVMSAYVDYTDRASCILFGDGASALLLSSENWEHEVVCTELGADPSGADSVHLGAREGSPNFHQDGHKVYVFAQNILIRMIDSLKKKAGLADGEPFYVIPHQANLRIVQIVSDKTGIPMDRFIMNIERYGNTSSASIGIALDEASREGRFRKGDHVFLIGFGGGLSWAGAVIKW